jgi:hypothetical protein
VWQFIFCENLAQQKFLNLAKYRQLRSVLGRGSCLTVLPTVEEIKMYSSRQEVGNQTTRRREGGVGRWVLAVRLKKRHPFFRLPQRRDRPFPYIEHPTDNVRAVFRYFHRPRGGGLNMEMYTTHHQTRWGGRNRRISGKMTLSLVNCFFAHLLPLGVFGSFECRISFGAGKMRAAEEF